MELLLAFVVALATTAALIPPLTRWAPTLGLTDEPGPRKVHSTAVPRVGGLAMVAGIVLPAFLTLEMSRSIQGLLIGLAVLLVFGLWDDSKSLGYRAKFAGQVIAVVLCMTVGEVRIDAVIAGIQLPPWASTVLTFFFLVGVTNAVNLSDGLDGLAGGMVLLCFSGIALLAAASGNAPVTGLALIEAGAILGFLRFNTHPARVFMGDSGSQVLGFTAGVLAILATQNEITAVSGALPLLLLGVPILDTVTVMLKRLRAGRSPFSADRNHLHHKLLEVGFAHREAVALIYTMQAALLLLAYFMRFESDVAITIAFCGFAAVVLGLLRLAAERHWKVRNPDGGGPLAAVARRLRAALPGSRIPQLALGTMAACLAAYAATVLGASKHVGVDVGALCLGMLIVLLLLSKWRAERPLQSVERGVAYVSVVLLVYLDQTSVDKTALFTNLSWMLLGVTGAAALVRFSLSPTRRFEVTALDLLVVILALVLPNLPGSVSLPPQLSAGIAKAIILLYVVELLLAAELKRPTQRAFLVLTLSVIAARGLFAAST